MLQAPAGSELLGAARRFRTVAWIGCSVSISSSSHLARESFRPLTLRRFTASGRGIELELSSGSLVFWSTSRLATMVDRLLHHFPELCGREAEWALRAGVPIVRAIACIAEVLADRPHIRWEVSERLGEPGVFVIAAPLAAERAAESLLAAIEAVEAVLPLHLQGVVGVDVLNRALAPALEADDGPRQAVVAVLEPT